MGTTLGRLDFGSKRKTVRVEVPQLEGSFNLRALSVAQLNELKGDDTNRLQKQLAQAIVDDSGQRIYTSDEDIANLSEMSVDVFGILFDALNELHGVSKKAVEETVKKSEASPSTDSVSA